MDYVECMALKPEEKPEPWEVPRPDPLRRALLSRSQGHGGNGNTGLSATIYAPFAFLMQERLYNRLLDPRAERIARRMLVSTCEGREMVLWTDRYN